LFIVGVLLLAFINTLYGFIIVARYDSINSFIFPSIFWTMALSLPLLHYFDIVSTPLIYLHPVMAPLTLLVGAFQPITLGEVGYGLLYSLVWIAILFKLAKGAFYRFIIMKQGVKA
jgi:fluoroquinolone transport system permease protein